METNLCAQRYETMGVFEGVFFGNVAAARQKAGLEIPLEVQPNGSYKIKSKLDAAGSLQFIEWDSLSPEKKAELEKALGRPMT
jgi:hypothetical protein